MSKYDEYRKRMQEATTRAELAEAYRAAIEEQSSGFAITKSQIDELTSLYVDICGDKGWRL